MEEPLILLCFSIVLMHCFSVWAIKGAISNLANELKQVVLERETTTRDSFKDTYDPLKDDNVYRM
tara:strand:+ start:1334 stop:1528 length:195 start_codon:yes stop_codon:yes gene_type:complete